MRSLEKVVVVANAKHLESSDAHADTDIPSNDERP
jgi:hypothetical protein